ncbi:helix-turn-helix domain-containing protein [Salipiger thiooxidans]|uniref:helix-turn-helix domain-containing protein n=1 Tax=Salipiger thiooxidans TaxID=282683 RepID=UPI001A8F3384|nr:helix-turn-helix domain-containing protein [Salipiger thiooxidans]MBN8189526.1 helix-turn-helix domain-containing protein [Salipiger thiooxidans]
MSVSVTSAAVAASSSTGVTRLVLLCLCDKAGDHGVAWPAVSTICEWTNSSERAVQKALKQLVEMGEIKLLEAGGGRNKPSRYLVSVGLDDTNTPQEKHRKPCGVSSENPAGKTPYSAKTPQNRSENPAECAPNPSINSSSSAREARSDDELYDEVLSAAGIRNGSMPTYWMPPAAVIHVGRWRSQLGLTDAEIISTVRECRKRHDNPPNGPKGLDGAMQRTAGAKVTELKPRTASQHGKPDEKSKRMAFYASITDRAGATQ